MMITSIAAAAFSGVQAFCITGATERVSPRPLNYEGVRFLGIVIDAVTQNANFIERHPHDDRWRLIVEVRPNLTFSEDICSVWRLAYYNAAFVRIRRRLVGYSISYADSLDVRKHPKK